MNKNRIMIIGGVLVTIIGLLLFNVSLSSTEDYLKDQIVDNLEITNVGITYDNDVTTFKADIKNTLDKEYDLSYIEIVIKNKDNEEIETLIGYIGNKLAKDEKKEIVTSVDRIIENISNIEYKIIK